MHIWGSYTLYGIIEKPGIKLVLRTDLESKKSSGKYFRKVKNLEYISVFWNQVLDTFKASRMLPLIQIYIKIQPHIRVD
jgi:hypothetical protein